MSTRSEPWEPGAPCWVDYGAADVEAASVFYADVMGWDVATPGAEDNGYAMCRVGDLDAAGIGPSPSPEAPPAWVVYLASTDVDATVAAARKAGGTVLAEPFDVMEAGRMAVLADPQGAVFGVWQARAHIGCGVVNEPGGLVWEDAAVADPEQARAFYAAVFGYTYDDMGAPDQRYRTFATTGPPLGGIGELDPPGTPPHWLVYFAVADTDTTVTAATGHGAEVVSGPTDTAYGRVATIRDPWGAVFAVMGVGDAEAEATG